MTFCQWFLAVYEEHFIDISDEEGLKEMEEWEAKYEYYCSVNGYFPIWDN